MKITFQPNGSVDDEIEIEIKAATQTDTIDKLIDYISNFKPQEQRIIPVKTLERIITIKVDQLVKVEVQGNVLMYYTTQQVVKANGRLYQVLENLSEDFVQVSRHSIINLNYLESIESGFAGNMVAMLAVNLRSDISRRYLVNLERKLGL
ncbi:LytTR family DNA-binding domain-containing protein [Limosilactobacillus equigenerosi]|uniref:HTH LytTR-type domain-containing protein n=1 Tax=Limosilactobacillus equigenerosi DSM 18793 = JCM 14505 TaxID=1423742 RepID=A0A0R1UPD3_9LACO|nr:LytTR family DNA-binding domain-containing protein [Limosilactobacillus equigenerosi]KRL95004.1 hypothetical protein FC21_GL001050 [Limosilactobacillus equigenerosi DSM 18793 = JCM 14505]